MKTLNQYIQEKLIVNKDYREAKIVIKSFYELRKIIEDRYKKLGPGTEQNPINFNDIDVSNLNSFCGKYDKGLFEETKFKYIDISDWDVSNVTDMSCMFINCEELKSVGDISKWDVLNVKSMRSMFFNCKELESVVDISNWNVSNVIDMTAMFAKCKSFNQDLSDWDLLKLKFKMYMFDKCPIKDEYKPKFKR